MDYLGKGVPLIFGRAAHFRSDDHHNPISSDIRTWIGKLFYLTKLAVDANDANLSGKCFALAGALLHHSNHQIRLLTKCSFVNAFKQLLKGEEAKRLKLFVPADFCNLFPYRTFDLAQKPNVQTRAEAPNDEIVYRLATGADSIYAVAICREMHDSAVARSCGISKREPSELIQKMKEGKAIIAVNTKQEWVGFSYMQVYENGAFVSNSGLIVSPEYRKQGVAWEIKQRVFELSRALYPAAKIFSITSGGAVMKMNTKLGFEPVCYADITKDPGFWQGCKSCVNHAVLLSKNCQNCLCTAMLFNPKE